MLCWDRAGKGPVVPIKERPNNVVLKYSPASKNLAEEGYLEKVPHFILSIGCRDPSHDENRRGEKTEKKLEPPRARQVSS